MERAAQHEVHTAAAQVGVEGSRSVLHHGDAQRPARIRGQIGDEQRRCQHQIPALSGLLGMNRSGALEDVEAQLGQRRPQVREFAAVDE